MTTLTVAVRHAATADGALLADLAAEASEGLLGERGGVLHRKVDLAAFDLASWSDQPDSALLVGTIDDAIVGYAAVAAVQPLALVRALYVSPDAREVGVGEELMDAVVAWARDRALDGVDAVALPGDRETKNFFETHGLVARAITVHRSLRVVSDPSTEADASQ